MYSSTEKPTYTVSLYLALSTGLSAAAVMMDGLGLRRLARPTPVAETPAKVMENRCVVSDIAHDIAGDTVHDTLERASGTER